MRARDAAFYRLKAATKDLVERCGGQVRVAELIGVSQPMVSRICSRDDAAMLAIQAKLLLERECGKAVLTAVEADIVGYRIERVAPLGDPDTCAFGANAAVMQEVADLCRTFHQSVADGVYSGTDAVLVQGRIRELRRQIERFERVNAATLAAEGQAQP